jgi:hypothetical protein
MAVSRSVVGCHASLSISSHGFLMAKCCLFRAVQRFRRRRITPRSLSWSRISGSPAVRGNVTAPDRCLVEPMPRPTPEE